MYIILVMKSKGSQFSVAVLLVEEGILFTGLLPSSVVVAPVGDDVAGVLSNIFGVFEGDSFTMSVIVSARPSSLIVSTTSSNILSSPTLSCSEFSFVGKTGEFSQ